MENAVKALFIAAGVFLGLMIISLGTSLFTSLNQYVESSQEEMANRELQKFNGQFTKYINDYGSGQTFTLTIQDIVTVANIAAENNRKYDLPEHHVIVKLDGQPLQNDINEKSAKLLAEGNGCTYSCNVNDVKFNTTTGRVNEISFSKITP